jgi:acyl-CoA thioester hydrolase
MSFHFKVSPRYGEVDMQGVVFNAHWLTYFDEAITRFFEWLGYDPKKTFESDFDFMVVKAVLEWKSGAGFTDEIDIEVSTARIGNASFDLAYAATVGERAVCDATITYVLIQPGKNKSMPIPEDLRAGLEKAG